MTATDTLRNSDLAQLSATLESQRARSLDLVMPARSIFVDSGQLTITGQAPVVTGEPEIPGVEATRPAIDINGRYSIGTVADEGLSDKLGIPLPYLRRLHTQRPDLYDANVNGWLETDPRSLMLRLLRTEPGDGGVLPIDGLPAGFLRAVLSDKYRTIDNLDVVLAALEGIRDAHPVGQIEVAADLTERRMYVRVTSQAIAAQALDLVRDYRDPGSGRTGRQYPLMFAGFVLTNSEVGEGRFSITPRVVLQVCTNGQTIAKDAMARTHLGAKLDEGVVSWSAETHRRNLDLITSQTRDAVGTFLRRSYVEAKVAELAAAANIELRSPVTVIETVSKRLGFTEAQKNDILAAFTKGATPTAGGVMHAVTYVAQQATDGDTAYALEAAALPALELAAAAARQ